MSTGLPVNPAGAEESAVGVNRLYAWYVVVLLNIAYVFSFIDRQIISLLVEPIKADLGVSDTQVSLLQGFAFALFYVFMGIPIAWAADRHNRTKIIAAGICVWSLMTALCGIAKSFTTLFLARIGVGVGEAALSPAAYSIIADYMPRRSLGRALSVYALGSAIGGALALIIGGYVIDRLLLMGPLDIPIVGTVRPWQLTFMIVGLPGLILAALMLLTVREPARKGFRRPRKTGAVATHPKLAEVIQFTWDRRRAYAPLFLGTALFSMASYGMSAWIPVFFMRMHGWTAGEIGSIYGSIMLVTGLACPALGGWLADSLYSRGRSDGAMRVMCWSMLLSTPLVIMAPLAPSATLSLVLFGGVGVFSAAVVGLPPAALQLITPNEMRAQISALFLFVVNVAGLGAGPTMVALVTDYVFGRDDALGYSLMIVPGIAMPVAGLLVFVGLRAYRGTHAEAESWWKSSENSPDEGVQPEAV